MNNEDMSDIIQKISTMMNNSNNKESSDIYEDDDISSNSNDTSINFQDILSNINFNSNNDNSQTNTNNNTSFDFETILKIKNVIDKFNSTQNSPENNLLMSLKPYLNNNRKQKLDQYIQFLNMAKILESFNGEVTK